MTIYIPVSRGLRRMLQLIVPREKTYDEWFRERLPQTLTPDELAVWDKELYRTAEAVELERLRSEEGKQGG